MSYELMYPTLYDGYKTFSVDPFWNFQFQSRLSNNNRDGINCLTQVVEAHSEHSILFPTETNHYHFGDNLGITAASPSLDHFRLHNPFFMSVIISSRKKSISPCFSE